MKKYDYYWRSDNMNIDKLKNIVVNTAKKENVTVQEVWDKYFFDQFLVRLSQSEYKANFILKGGFLLENIVGIKNRTTLDLDFSYRLAKINKEDLQHKISTIIAEDVKDQISFELRDIKSINEEGKYGGFRIRIDGNTGNIRKTFSIDVVSGDIITPYPQLLEYKTDIRQQTIKVYSYNKETILAEKFQTVISRGINNTRMKDFYDICMLTNDKSLDRELLHDVLINTFENRKTSIKASDIEPVISDIINSKLLERQFNESVRKAQFARDLEYSNVIDALVIAFKSIKYIKEIKLKIKSLLIIRQGETEQSIAGGWFDSRLTQSGVTQITRLKDEISEKIKDLEEVYILSSDLNRARETVKILFNDKYPIKYDQRLRESNDAHLTSLDVDATKTKHHNEQLDKIEFGENYPNEESAEGYYNRVYDCFLGINEQYQNKNVVIVTHEGAYGIIKSIINGTVWSSKQRYVLGCSEVFAYQVQP